MNAKILNQKMELIQWLSSLEDKSIIEKLVKFKQMETIDWWNTISDEEKTSIEKGISDAENGKLVSHKSVMNLYEKLL